MKTIQINDSKQTVSDIETLTHILDRLNIEHKGIAIASGERIIPKKTWNEYLPADGEILTIIKATCGG